MYIKSSSHLGGCSNSYVQDARVKTTMAWERIRNFQSYHNDDMSYHNLLIDLIWDTINDSLVLSDLQNGVVMYSHGDI
jgi:hypothetical protein